MGLFAFRKFAVAMAQHIVHNGRLTHLVFR
jgi:hypothetical protein